MASNDKSIFQTLKSPINKSCLAFEAVVYNLSEAGKRYIVHTSVQL